MPHRDISVQYHWKNLRLYIQPGPALNVTLGHKHPVIYRTNVRLYIQPGPALNVAQGHKYPVI